MESITSGDGAQMKADIEKLLGHLPSEKLLIFDAVSTLVAHGSMLQTFSPQKDLLYQRVVDLLPWGVIYCTRLKDHS